MFSECKIPRAWNANIHLQMVPHWYLSPRSYSALGNTTNSQECLCTFQVFIDATKITNVWSQQHSLFLEWANLEFIMAHVQSVPACSKKVGRPESKISCSCKLLLTVQQSELQMCVDCLPRSECSFSRMMQGASVLVLVLVWCTQTVHAQGQ